jgi:hypothetical protein
MAVAISPTVTAASGPSQFVAEPSLQRVRLTCACIAALEAKKGTPFDVIHDMEGLAARDDLGDVPIRKTVFGEMVRAMQKIDPAIPFSMRGFQQALGVTDEQVHDIGCWCHEKKRTMLGSVGADRMRALRNGNLGQYRAYPRSGLIGPVQPVAAVDGFRN